MTNEPRRGLDLALRLAVCAGVVGLAAFAIVNSQTVFTGGLAWLVAIFAALSGWGSLLTTALAIGDADVGLRLLWGAVAYLVVAGGLFGAGLASQPAIQTLLALGMASFCLHELRGNRPIWRHVVAAARVARAEPGRAALYTVIAVIALIHAVGGVARLDANPFDDDVSYTALLKRLLDIGDMDDPFNFRRISAYGGQTLLQALGGARGSIENVHLVDRSVFETISLLLIVGYGRKLRAPAYWTALVVMVVLLLPDVSINTASYWTGLAFFLGLYRTITLVDGERPLCYAVLAAATAAMTCTLRQNYLPVAVLLLVVAMLFRLRGRARVSTWRDAWRGEQRLWLWAAVAGVVCLAPYLVASWTSNRTFLYPYMPGTFNPNLTLQPSVFSIVQELRFFGWVFIEPEPIRVLPLLLPLLLITRDLRASRPLVAFLIVNVLGLVVLVHGFTMSDPGNLWRYAFGYVVALTAVFALEVGALGMREDGKGVVALPVFARFVLVIGLMAQIGVVRGLPNRYREIGEDIAEARSRDRRPGAAVAEHRARYQRMQASLPAGARVAFLLDEPFYLDFARNDFYNLDAPGYASLPPGMPMFQGPEAVREYFLGLGIRHLAFVRNPDESRYFYRREFWVRRIFIEAEIWRIMGSYMVDCLDNFDELAKTSRVLHDADSMVVIDLQERR
jgi:hypothetical protein